MVLPNFVSVTGHHGIFFASWKLNLAGEACADVTLIADGTNGNPVRIEEYGPFGRTELKNISLMDLTSVRR